MLLRPPEDLLRRLSLLLLLDLLFLVLDLLPLLLLDLFLPLAPLDLLRLLDLLRDLVLLPRLLDLSDLFFSLTGLRDLDLRDRPLLPLLDRPSLRRRSSPGLLLALLGGGDGDRL